MGPLCFTSQVKRGGSLLHPSATGIKLSSAPPSMRTRHAPHPPPQCHAHDPRRRPAGGHRQGRRGDPQVPRRRDQALERALPGRGEDEGRVGGEAAEAQGAVPRHARPLAAAGEDAAQGDRHRHARARRRRHREAALPEQAGPVRHRQPVPAEGRAQGQEAPGDPLRLRPLRPRPRRQQDGVPGPRHVVRLERLRLPGRRHAAARRGRGHAPRHLQPEPLLVAQPRLHAGRRRVLERHPRHRLPVSAGPTWTRSRSA